MTFWIITAAYMFIMGFMFWHPYFYQAKTFKESIKACFENPMFVLLFIMCGMNVFIAIGNDALLVGYVLVVFFSFSVLLDVFRKHKKSQG